MITAKDELAHMVDGLTERQAEAILALIERRMPKTFWGAVEESPRYHVTRADGRVVMVSVPE